MSANYESYTNRKIFFGFLKGITKMVLSSIGIPADDYMRYMGIYL
jgi:hypothetical protein